MSLTVLSIFFYLNDDNIDKVCQFLTETHYFNKFKELLLV